MAIVIAAVLHRDPSVDLDTGRAAELATPEDECIEEESALLQIFYERGKRLVDKTVVGTNLRLGDYLA